MYIVRKSPPRKKKVTLPKISLEELRDVVIEPQSTPENQKKTKRWKVEQAGRQTHDRGRVYQSLKIRSTWKSTPGLCKTDAKYLLSTQKRAINREENIVEKKKLKSSESMFGVV